MNSDSQLNHAPGSTQTELISLKTSLISTVSFGTLAILLWLACQRPFQTSQVAHVGKPGGGPAVIAGPGLPGLDGPGPGQQIGPGLGGLDGPDLVGLDGPGLVGLDGPGLGEQIGPGLVGLDRTGPSSLADGYEGGVAGGLAGPYYGGPAVGLAGPYYGLCLLLVGVPLAWCTGNKNILKFSVRHLAASCTGRTNVSRLQGATNRVGIALHVSGEGGEEGEGTAAEIGNENVEGEGTAEIGDENVRAIAIKWRSACYKDARNRRTRSRQTSLVLEDV